MSKWPWSSRYLVRLIDDRLQAESSRNMYSEQGLLALIRSVFAQVCQSLIVLSYCTPGSAQPHALSQIIRHSSRALCVEQTWPVVLKYVRHSPSFSTARMNASVTRTELFEFWPEIVWYASPLKSAL